MTAKMKGYDEEDKAQEIILVSDSDTSQWDKTKRSINRFNLPEYLYAVFS